MTVRLSPLDMNKNELQNARIQNLAAAPASPVAGQVYFNTTDSKFYWYDGSAWVLGTGSSTSYGAVTAQTSYGLSSGNGSASTVARSDHTHGTPALSSNAASAMTPGDSASNGSGTAPAKDDHKHSLPGWGVAGSMAAAGSFGGSNAAGSGATFARIDHQHALPAHDASAHSGISLSSLAAPSTDVAWNSKKITGLADPTSAQDAATKAYVDATATGLDVKASVRAIATSNITLSGTQTIDGVACVAGDRVLVAGQSTGADNGIYVVAAGAWSRAQDANTSAQVTSGMFTFVSEGTANADSGWVLATNDPITLGTTALSFVQFSGAGQVTAGNGLTKTGNTLDVGAGTGITVAADTVSIDTSVVMRRYAVDVGDGTSTSINVTHGLGTKDVTVQVYRKSDGIEVECDVTRSSTSVVALGFTVAPTSAQYRCVVIG